MNAFQEIVAEKQEAEGEEEDKNLTAVADVEAGIRDFVRKDVAYLRRSYTQPAPAAESEAAEATVNNVNSLIQRVAGTSLGEIEKLIDELENLRSLLHAEGERVQREIAGYAQLSQSAMKSTRLIAENMAQWKTVASATLAPEPKAADRF